MCREHYGTACSTMDRIGKAGVGVCIERYEAIRTMREGQTGGSVSTPGGPRSVRLSRQLNLCLGGGDVVELVIDSDRKGVTSRPYVFQPEVIALLL